MRRGQGALPWEDQKALDFPTQRTDFCKVRSVPTSSDIKRGGKGPDTMKEGTEIREHVEKRKSPDAGAKWGPELRRPVVLIAFSGNALEVRLLVSIHRWILASFLDQEDGAGMRPSTQGHRAVCPCARVAPGG